MSETPAWPVLEVLTELKEVVRSKPVVLLQAPPGAGKSTVLPLELLHEPWLTGQKIVMLQPRRIAARAVATRLASQLGEQPGARVGYRIRFEVRESAATRILVVTEGILVRMLQDDPALEGIGMVILDEFHERSLHADLSLVLCREAQKIMRPDLRLLVMSATLDEDRLSSRLGAPVIRSSGRQFPIEFHYLGFDQRQPLPNQMAGAIRRALRENNGDVLAFLPGAGEIRRTESLLDQPENAFEVLPLYGDLSFADQQRAILPDPNGRRRVILATSIAETSLTIEGISVVVDSGLSRVPRFDPGSGLTRLVTVPVTLDAAMQRAGRAGRLGPGVCYRLWELHRTASLQPSRKPEISEADLAPLLLELLAWGAQDPYALDWIDAPPRGHIAQAWDLLRLLDAVDGNSVTVSGRRLVTMPAHPRLAHMLWSAGDPVRKAIACDLAALLEERDPLNPESGADVRLRLEGLMAWRRQKSYAGDRRAWERIDKLSAFWRRRLSLELPLEKLPVEPIEGALLAAAYPDRIGSQLDRAGNRYRLANGRVLALDRNDPLHQSSWIVAASADYGVADGRIFLAAALDPSTIKSAKESRLAVQWDTRQEALVASRRELLGPLILSTRVVQLPPEGSYADLMTGAVRDMGLTWAGAGDDFRVWQARVESIRRWRSGESWPDVSDEVLLTRLEDWLNPFLSGISSRAALQRLDWKMMASTLLPYDLSARLEKLVPEKIDVPSGSRIKVEYFIDGRTPELHVRLQEIFGWTQTPAVNEGLRPVMLHLLSPAYRPVQITADLRSFWSGTYHEVRKELRARYPKHSWPEDPLTAEAVRGPRKRK